MDPGRYGPQQGWDNNSALKGYGAVHESNFRASGSYDERRFPDDRFPRDNMYKRGAFQRNMPERDNYTSHPPATGLWSQSKRKSYEEDYPVEREARHYEKPYIDPYNEMDAYRGDGAYRDSYQDLDRFHDDYNVDTYRDHGHERASRFGSRDHDDYMLDEHDYRPRDSHHSRESSRDRDYEYSRRSYDSDYDRGSRRDSNWRRHGSYERESDKRSLSRDRDSPRKYERSRSRGHDDRHRSRSPRSRSRGHSYREDSYDDDRYERSERRREREDKYYDDHYSVAPSATLVVKGLSQKTTEEDLYQILAEWGPLQHVRVIKERNSGVSRGFAFIDFSSVDAAKVMMDKIGSDGLVVDGRKVYFEYSKPTGPTSYSQDSAVKSNHFSHRGTKIPSDWMCTLCGCVNFARRMSCFQCNEARTDDAPPAEISSSTSGVGGRRGQDAGPTHVLVVRGLDENADEEMIRYEFSKHAPIKDLRLVRDKFTHVSRGFAFVHFHSVDDATKALEATNGTTLEKNGQILRVAYAKSILGPASGIYGSSQSSSLAAAAIEAAAFSQQYDAVGWAPKEYNPDEKQHAGGQEPASGQPAVQGDSTAPQSGFVWDEASGYYYDAASGFYYDGNTGLYYDGNNGIWYSFDQQTQQYVPCTDQSDKKMSGKQSDSSSKATDGSNKKAVISAPAATINSSDKAGSLADAVQAAAAAALAAEKKEKEKQKEIKLASKSSILANKKKMNNVLSMWKQRTNEGQAPRVALDGNQPSTNDKPDARTSAVKTEIRAEATVKKDGGAYNARVATSTDDTSGLESTSKPKHSSASGSVTGVIRGSGRGIVKSDTSYTGLSGPASTSTHSYTENSSATPFRTDVSALGSYAPPSSSGTGRRRFSEQPLSSNNPNSGYRDRAAERRSLYGSSSSTGDDLSDLGIGDSNHSSKKGLSDSMPFPPGVGGSRPAGDGTAQSFEVITPNKAIDETNVGNRMLRNMGWHEGSGLGKDGSGMVEPVQAQGMDARAGLGSQQKKAVDPSLEVQAGDSYRTLIQKKALARFKEMS
uniref:Uncharacterized protein n=1 Tax=Kalanchoe fedtschenkoi TaxID=63787 RepID=A0A7N1A5P5_KALFE